MAILSTKASNNSQFVDYQKVPAYTAEADTSVILAAYLDGLSSLLTLCGDEVEESVLQGMYTSLTMFVSTRDKIEGELEKADVMMEAIRAKLAI